MASTLEKSKTTRPPLLHLPECCAVNLFMQSPTPPLDALPPRGRGNYHLDHQKSVMGQTSKADESIALHVHQTHLLMGASGGGEDCSCISGRFGFLGPAFCVRHCFVLADGWAGGGRVCTSGSVLF